MRNLGYETAPVHIEDNVWIGAGVIVLKGVTIGEGSVIAAGTVVNKDIPRNSIVYNSRELVVKKRIEGM
jgi:acetyltransferase-like isoleucine patch superfamily enzyme